MDQQRRNIDAGQYVAVVGLGEAGPAVDEWLRGQRAQPLAHRLHGRILRQVVAPRRLVHALANQPQHRLGKVLPQLGHEALVAQGAEIAIDAVRPLRVGEQLRRLVDEDEPRQLRATEITDVLPQGERAHRMADRHHLLQIVILDELAQIARHAGNRRRSAGLQRMPAVAAGIPADHPVTGLEGLEKWIPVAMGGSPAMQQDQRRPFARGLVVDRLAVVGAEMFHGWEYK